MKKLILSVVGVLILLLIVLLFQSAPIDPAPYTPPKAPELTGELAPNTLLQKGELLALDENGKITQSPHEPTGNRLKEITSAREYGGFLYLESLHNDRIGKYKLGG
jgi:hypothetical protein